MKWNVSVFSERELAGPQRVGGGVVGWLVVRCMHVHSESPPLPKCSGLHSAVPGQRGHQGEGAAAQHPAVLAGAPAAQRGHHRVRNQILREGDLNSSCVSSSLPETPSPPFLPFTFTLADSSFHILSACCSEWNSQDSASTFFVS